MANTFKYNDDFSDLLFAYKTDVASINHAKEEVTFTDSQNVMIENYAGMLDTMFNSIFSYKKMVAENVSSMENVIAELKEMDDDLQNNF